MLTDNQTYLLNMAKMEVRRAYRLKVAAWNLLIIQPYSQSHEKAYYQEAVIYQDAVNHLIKVFNEIRRRNQSMGVFNWREEILK